MQICCKRNYVKFDGEFDAYSPTCIQTQSNKLQRFHRIINGKNLIIAELFSLVICVASIVKTLEEWKLTNENKYTLTKIKITAT